VPNTLPRRVPAGFLQWKALVGLFLDCQRGPLLSHTGLFVAFLATVQQQLSAGLGLQQKPQRRQQRRRGGIGEGEGSSSDDTEDEGDRGASSEGGGALGLPLVEELLPDSFLRRQFGAFLEALHEEGTGSPPALTQQVRVRSRGGEVSLQSSLGCSRQHACCSLDVMAQGCWMPCGAGGFVSAPSC
jgi:hypothetical protein